MLLETKMDPTKKKPKWVKPKITLKPFVYLGLNKNFASLHQRPKESNHKIIHMQKLVLCPTYFNMIRLSKF